MKQHFSIQQAVVIAFLVIAIVSANAFWSGYAGRVLFNIGPDGIRLELDGGD